MDQFSSSNSPDKLTQILILIYATTEGILHCLIIALLYNRKIFLFLEKRSSKSSDINLPSSCFGAEFWDGTIAVRCNSPLKWCIGRVATFNPVFRQKRN